MQVLGRVRDRILPIIERPLDRFSSVGAATFFDHSLFPWLEEVEARYPGIRAELDEVLAERDSIPTFEEVLPSQAGLDRDRAWKTFMFYGYGHRSDVNLRRCPRTAAGLELIPGLVTAFFSILGPGKHIPSHRGFYKGVLRYHLALKVPAQAERCRIRVGGDIRHWEEGRSLVFDDTFEHEVWNDTDEERVVLFVDFIRPLPAPLSSINAGVVSAIGWLPEIRRAAKAQHLPT